jgi:ribose 5-phosphate isomerase B
MKISIASDHAGFDLKSFLVEQLREKGFDVFDRGAHELNPDDDYPFYISQVAQDVSAYEEARMTGNHPTHNTHGHPHAIQGRDVVGIVIGGSGQGEAIVANKFSHIRAATVYGGAHSGGSLQLLEDITKLSRLHNDSNILSLGARFMTSEEALSVVLLWLRTEFSDETRHERRIDEIDILEHGIDEHII